MCQIVCKIDPKIWNLQFGTQSHITAFLAKSGIPNFALFKANPWKFNFDNQNQFDY